MKKLPMSVPGDAAASAEGMAILRASRLPQGRSLLGDLAAASKDADVLVCEAMNTDMMRANIERIRAVNPLTAGLLQDAIDYHSPVTDIAKLARDAGVKKLVLSHLIPAVPDEGPAADQFVAGMSDIFAGELVLGRDLMRFEVG